MNQNVEYGNQFTLDVAPGLEAPGGLGGLGGMRSRRGGTGGKDVWGGIDIGDGGLSTCKTPKDKPLCIHHFRIDALR